jgi:glycosyltransferase involved in cell wall biosynthesis
VSEFPRLADGEEADICLLLEGTYPYVRGGVSSWVHQLIRGLPEHRFALVFVGANREFYPEMRYELPSNVCHLEVHFMSEPSKVAAPHERAGDDDWFASLEELHSSLKTYHQPLNLQDVATFIKQVRAREGEEAEEFLYSECAWARIIDGYRTNCPNMPFGEYFWNIRAMHAPLFILLNIARQAPQSKIYHTISTGYAGFLGFLLRVLRRRPLLLTEHGIYTKERYIDLYQAEWIKEKELNLPMGLYAEISYLRRLWGHFFEGLGRLTYSACLQIITLYENNRLKQVEYGAEPKRTRVIPNGVNLERFVRLRDLRTQAVPPVLGLIGRVVPIKDIKTYIRAVGLAARQMPEIEGWIVGPEDEEPRYAEECHALVANLGLENKIKFLGFQNIDDILPKIGLMTLSSISEGQPLVILEGYAAGVPVLSTDVGSCRELAEGYSEEDKALGHAGAIVPIANPAAMADAAVSLLRDEQRWYAAQKAAIARVERFYTEQTFLQNYRVLYRKVLEHGRNRI